MLGFSKWAAMWNGFDRAEAAFRRIFDVKEK